MSPDPCLPCGLPVSLTPLDHQPDPQQGTVLEIMRATYERGGVLAFFSGNDAGMA